MMVTCPYCGRCVSVDLHKANPGILTSATGVRYDHVVDTPWTTDSGAPTSLDLAPGETATIRTPIRPQTIEADVAVPVLQALAYGVGGALVSIVPTVAWDKWPWYAPLLVLPGITGAALFVTPERARGLLERVEKFVGVDINGDGQIGTEQIVTSTVNVNDGAGRTTTSNITTTRSQARHWREFCEHVRDGVCNLSRRQAGQHGIDLGLFDAIVDEWACADPKLQRIYPETVGPRRTMKLTDLGEATVAGHATTPLPELVTDLERATGADRQTDREE